MGKNPDANLCFSGRVVVIGEASKTTEQAEYAADRTLMMAEDYYVRSVVEALEHAGYETAEYQSPNSFLANIDAHANDVVLSLWSGAENRNSLTYVAALCELKDVMYVGPDVYARIIERDKLLSQQQAVHCGFNAPQALAMGPYSSLESLARMEYPIVIKPRLEGSSIGIYEDSKADTFEHAVSLARRLNDIGIHELIAQRFVPGREVHIPVIGNSATIDVLDVCETFLPEHEDFFDTNLFHANIKNRRPYRWGVRTIESEVMSTELRERTIRFFRAMGSPNIMRIDGKLVDEQLCFIEVNSFPDIGRKSVAACAYQFRGGTYEDFLSSIIASVITDN